MFDETDARLEAWVKSSLAGAGVSLSPPADDAEEKTVSLYLMDVVSTPPARGVRQPPIQFTLRYLITTRAADPKDAHRMLGQLMVAAADVPEFEVEPEPLSGEFWSSFGICPRPAFIIRVPFKHERKEREVKPVRFPLVLENGPMAQLQGRILSTSDFPIAGAKVELPFFKLYTMTDSDGRFRFAAVPTEPENKDFIVRAKGREFSVSTKQAEREGGVLVIQLPMEE